MWRRSFQRKRKRGAEIQPDEIFIDSQNPAEYDTDAFEGRLERPLSRQSLFAVGGFLTLLSLVLLARAGELQLMRGEALAKQALENQLAEVVIFADRGQITDRTGVRLAWNERYTSEDDFAQRVYTNLHGTAHIVGYVNSPAKDTSGFYFRETHEGVTGMERVFDAVLSGENGIELTETDARGTVVSKAQVKSPVPGEKLILSVDAELSSGLYDALRERVEGSHFTGGAGVVMDVKTGELLALVNYPEFSPNALTAGSSTAIESLQNDPREPFLNRAVGGLYAPGSIVKPFMLTAALTEGIIDENKEILSTGSITIPNPYNPSLPSVFKDWRANGWTDARRAIAVSSDIYFYAVGGGYGDQRGLGIALIDEYLRLFGFGTSPGLAGFSAGEGVIPTPAWKEATFDGDPWRLGDTYNTAIGQYGLQITPLQAVRAVSALANGGTLLSPSLLASSTPAGVRLPLNPHALQVAREGMRMAVKEGTAAALATPYVEVGGKTGTAQVGVRNQFMNSWVIGFFPYENPHYAFAVVLEHAPAGTTVGAPAAMRTFLDWLHSHAPAYLQ